MFNQQTGISMYTLNDVLSRFHVSGEPVPYSDGTKYVVHCPTAAHPHGDRNPSAALIVHANGYVEPVCLKGCTAHEIFGAVGLPYPLRVTDVEPVEVGGRQRAQRAQRAQRKNTQTAPVVERKNEGNSKTADAPPNKGNGETAGETADARPNAFEIMQKFRSPGDGWVLRPPLEVYPIFSSYTDSGERVATKYRVDWVHTETGERRKDFRVEWLGEKRPLSELPLYLAARLPFSVNPVSTPPRVSVILEGERKALQAALLWLHSGRVRHHPELAPHATFWGGYGSNVIPTPDAMAATLWNNFADTDTVVFAPDNDEAGRRWCANMIARAREASQQTGRPLKLYVLEWRSAPEGGDLADLFERSLRPTADGESYIPDPETDPWSELDVWRAAEWLEQYREPQGTEPQTQDAQQETQRAGSKEDEWDKRYPGCVFGSAELLEASDFPPIETIPFMGLSGYIIRGGATVFAGYPKTGKTEALFYNLREWLLLGFRVLYISEESPMFLHDRSKAFRLAEAERIGGGRVKFFSPTLEVTREKIVQCILDHPTYEIVVIDTIRTNLQLTDETSNSVVERELRPVVMAARLNRQTLILAHHLHKSGGQHGTEVAGGHAIIGGVDGYLSLLRDPHHEFRRIVRGTVRRIKVEELVYEMIKDGEFLVLGERREVERVELRRNALQVLSKANEPWNLTQVCSALSERGVKEHSKRVRAALDWLTEQGFAVRDPAEEKKGKTYKWQITDAGRQWLQDTTQAATQSQATPDPVNQAALQNYLNELDENW